MPAKRVLQQAEDEMKKAVEFLKQELRGVRTGQATPALVDSLRIEVESYGSAMALKELANIAVAEGNVIIIKPYDPSTLKDILRGIEKSELGINPQSDGKMVRLPVPALSTERRNQLSSHVKQMTEQQKVAIRNIRRDANRTLDTAKKDKTLSEDEVEKTQTRVQQLTDDYCKKLDGLAAQKSKEIMEV
ncbi:MAG: ribosome recycling factor [Phycisphaerae bacterium]|jgi:ribosome recycling factor